MKKALKNSFKTMIDVSVNVSQVRSDLGTLALAVSALTDVVQNCSNLIQRHHAAIQDLYDAQAKIMHQLGDTNAMNVAAQKKEAVDKPN